MKFVLIDLIFRDLKKFPQPHKAIAPIIGVLYQEIDGDNTKMGYISLPTQDIVTQAVKDIEMVATEQDLIRRLQVIIGGTPERMGDGGFVVDWSGFDYQYLLGRSCVLDIHMPNACGHMSLTPILKEGNRGESLSAKHLYEDVNAVVPVGDFYEFKFNVMAKLLSKLPKTLSLGDF